MRRKMRRMGERWLLSFKDLTAGIVLALLSRCASDDWSKDMCLILLLRENAIGNELSCTGAVAARRRVRVHGAFVAISSLQDHLIDR